MATDVLGRVVEVVSGQSLDAFLADRVLGPLGMTDTAFFAAPEDHGRLAALYAADPQTGLATRFDTMGRAALRPPDALSGGGGLVSTAADYLRFAHMLLGGGEAGGTRLLGPRTLAYMARNHLPGGVDLAAFGRPLFAETIFEGVGFGLGFSVVEDPVAGALAVVRGRVRLGRRREHGVLDRPGRAARRRCSSRSSCRRARTRSARSCTSSSTRRSLTGDEDRAGSRRPPRRRGTGARRRTGSMSAKREGDGRDRRLARLIEDCAAGRPTGPLARP